MNFSITHWSKRDIQRPLLPNDSLYSIVVKLEKGSNPDHSSLIDKFLIITDRKKYKKTVFKIYLHDKKNFSAI